MGDGRKDINFKCQTIFGHFASLITWYCNEPLAWEKAWRVIGEKNDLERDLEGVNRKWKNCDVK